MKRYEPYIECCGSDFEHVALKELDSGSVVTYEDAARIIAQRDRLLQLVSDMLPYVELCDHEGTNAEELREEYPESAAVIDALRARALAELDKEKQS